MLKGIGRDVRIVAVSVVTSALVVGVPAAAAVYATNSDKVDGKHAVGAKADAATRAGKLVATNKQGQFPNNIIAKALDADLLDGLDSTDFLGATDTAIDSDLLDGKNSTDFLGATGKATDSDLLDGVDSSGFMKGGGSAHAFNVTVAAGSNFQRFVTHANTAGARGLWFFQCPSDTNHAAYLNYYNWGTAPTQVYVARHGAGGTWFEQVASGGHMFIRDHAAVNTTGDMFSWTLSTPDKNLLVTAQVTARRTTTGCAFTGYAVETPLS